MYSISPCWSFPFSWPPKNAFINPLRLWQATRDHHLNLSPWLMCVQIGVIVLGTMMQQFPITVLKGLGRNLISAYLYLDFVWCGQCLWWESWIWLSCGWNHVFSQSVWAADKFIGGGTGDTGVRPTTLRWDFLPLSVHHCLIRGHVTKAEVMSV